MRRKHLFTMRLSEIEKQKIDALATESGMTIADLIRSHLQKKTVINRKVEEEEQRKKQVILGRINRDLNMLAKHANIYKSGSDTVKILFELSEIKKKITDKGYEK